MWAKHCRDVLKVPEQQQLGWSTRSTRFGCRPHPLNTDDDLMMDDKIGKDWDWDDWDD